MLRLGSVDVLKNVTGTVLGQAVGGGADHPTKYSGHSSRKCAIHGRGTVSGQTSSKMGRFMLAAVNESATF